MSKRSFILGDEWLYYKIYSGAKTSDLILTNIIGPVTTFLIKENIIDKWFFIRYADPKHHIRFRVNYKSPEAVGEIISCLHPHFNDYVNEDLIWKIQTDTYNRELERYGSNTMELSEAIFFHDSNAVSNFLGLIEGDEGEELRWLFGLRIIDSLLDYFSYTTLDKLTLLERLKTGFGNEFSMNRFLKKQLDDKYRQKRKKIEEFLNFDEQGTPDYMPIFKILSIYKNNILPLAEKLLYLNTHKKLEVELDSLLSSYIHMTLNRLFKSKSRAHELVCYDFLYRHYKSNFARKQQKS